MLHELTDKCPGCGLPAKPAESCPYCQLTVGNLEPLMFWRQTNDCLPASYHFEGPVHAFLGHWNNPDEQNGMWHARIDDYHFFLPASLTDTDALRAVEKAMSRWLMKIQGMIWQINSIGGHLPIQIDTD